MKKTIKILSLIFALLLLLSVLSIPVGAEKFNGYEDKAPYYSYEYNCYNELSAAPDGYLPSDIIYISDFGENLQDAVLSDMYYDGKKLYLLDSENGRIIVLNKDYSLIEIITGDDISAGNYTDIDCHFAGASGIFVEPDGKILVCDTNNERVLFIRDRTVVGMIERPDSSALSENIKFDVKKVVKAGSGYYVCADSVTSGTMMFDENCQFVCFFGSNNVAVTAEVLLYTIQRAFMSDEQIAASRKFSASIVASLDVDNNDFVVVVSSDKDLTISGSAVRRLNFKGSDVATNGTNGNFGDKEITVVDANVFSDISVDDQNFYVILDSKYGRVFVYSENGILVSAFGGYGTETGMFSLPVAVETVGNEILVLDSETNSITVFDPTDYGNIKRELLMIIDTGKYEKIAGLADDLLTRNTNSQYAYYAKGFVAEQKGDYETALGYYKQANDQASYAQCYKLLRTKYVKSHFILIALAIILLVAILIFGIVLLNRGLTKKQGMTYAPLEHKKGFPLYCLFHPADGFSQIKERKLLSPVWLIGILAVWVYISISSFFMTGFIFNPNRAVDFDLIVELSKSLGLITVFTVANWAICTLMEGKGKPFEILYTVVYSMIPYVLALLIKLPLSRILTSDEEVIISIIMAIGTLWTVMVMFVGLLTIHEYSVGKAIFSIILTLLGMAIIILLLIMFFTLIAQTLAFVQSLIEEYSFRH